MNNYDVSEKAFGVQLGSFVLVIGLVVVGFLGETQTGAITAVIGSLLAGLALLVPRAFVLPNRAWGGLARVIARFLGPIVLAVVFFIILSPVAILRRTLGADPLQLQDQSRSSYWKVRREDNSTDQLKTMF